VIFVVSETLTPPANRRGYSLAWTAGCDIIGSGSMTNMRLLPLFITVVLVGPLCYGQQKQPKSEVKSPYEIKGWQEGLSFGEFLYSTDLGTSESGLIPIQIVVEDVDGK
jgi:hypothetical protein